MRIVKEAEERRNEILDTAEQLFIEKGYDSASTNDILDRIGIARGTLYYHFGSKEEILDAIIERLTDRIVQRVSEAAGDKQRPVLERLIKSLMAMNADNETGAFVIEQIHKPQNALMHQKSNKKLTERINPILTGLVREGIKEGLFSTDHPDEAVDMIMLYSNIEFDGLNEMEEEVRLKKTEGFIYNVERLLGAGQGSLVNYIKPLFAPSRV